MAETRHATEIEQKAKYRISTWKDMDFNKIKYIYAKDDKDLIEQLRIYENKNSEYKVIRIEEITNIEYSEIRKIRSNIEKDEEIERLKKVIEDLERKDKNGK